MFHNMFNKICFNSQTIFFFRFQTMLGFLAPLKNTKDKEEEHYHPFLASYSI